MIYPCQCCKDDVTDGIIRRAPGAVRQGRKLMEQMVCSDCHIETKSALDEQIWKDHTVLSTTSCNMCGEDFGAAGPYYAHRRPSLSGDWVMAPVCSGCFDKYHECCKNQMNGGK